MHNSAWKKERDLLSEAYAAVNETIHSPENSCKDDEFYCPVDKVCKKKDDTKEKPNLTEELGDDELNDIAPTPGDIADVESSPVADELDADVRDLISLIANPPPEEELTRLGYEGRLSEYVAMLQKKVDAAQAQLDLRKPAESNE